MQSHKLELDLEVNHLDSFGKLKYTYTYPFKESEENTVTFDVFNSDGSKSSSQTFPVRSFVTNFVRWFSEAWGAGGDNLIDTSAAALAAANALNFLNVNAALNDATFGIWVGTGATSTSISSYAPTGQCASGSGTNQLAYKSTYISAPVTTATGQRLTVRRSFTNNSGGVITITRSGLLGKVSTGEVYLALVDTTDIDNTTINIPIINAQSFTVTYNFDISSTGDYVGNFLTGLQSAFGSSSVNLTATTGVAATLNLANLDCWNGAAGANVDTWGIVVGSGSAAKDIASYKLDAQCGSGSGLNQLVYSATTNEATSVGSSYAQFSAIRTFTNSSAAPISIREAGIYIHGANLPIVNTQDNKKICVVRSVFDPVTAEIGESFQIKYTMRVAH